MGHGSGAAIDSAMATSLISRLITAGVSFDAALKMVNSAMLVKSGEESLATVDIVAVDLYTGKTEFYKAGAAPTYVHKSGRSGSVESTSLPAGILSSIRLKKPL
jgi:stage II sporulation protein E